jgi:hypothetical protein
VNPLVICGYKAFYRDPPPDQAYEATVARFSGFIRYERPL